MISNRSWSFLEFASLKLYVLPTIILYFTEIHIFTPNIVYHFTNKHLTPYRSIMVDVSVVSFVRSDNKNHVPQCRVFRQPPVINRDGWSWWVFELSGIDVIEKLGIRIHSFFFQVSSDTVSKFWRNYIRQEICVEENTLDRKHNRPFVPKTQIQKDKSDTFSKIYEYIFVN